MALEEPVLVGVSVSGAEEEPEGGQLPLNEGEPLAEAEAQGEGVPDEVLEPETRREGLPEDVML